LIWTLKATDQVGFKFVRSRPEDVDFQVLNANSIFILTPLTDAADSWVEERVSLTEETQYWGKKGIVIEHRYISDIIEGILNDGLTMEAAA
jgi:hypothetical protein